MNPESISSVSDPLWGVLIRLAVELAVLLIIIAVIYRRFSGKKENMFSYFLMGITIFLICVLLKNVEIQLGIALGLFAIFSIVRFRTSNYSAKDMSYLFTIMGLSAINAMFDFPQPIRGTILFNSIIIITILGLELTLKEREKAGDNKSDKKNKKKAEKKVEKKVKKEKARNRILLIYDNLKLLNPESRIDLLKDISSRIGKSVYEVRIRKVDLAAGKAELFIFFKDDTGTEEK